MNINISNIENFIQFLDDTDILKYAKWVDPIFIAMLKAKTSSQNRPMPTSNGYINNMNTLNYSNAKTYSPIEQIRSRADIDKISEHIVAVMLKNFDLSSADIKDLKYYLRYLFSELMNNVVDHSHSVIGGYAMAQFYPNKKHIQFAIADSGVGFLENIKLKYPHISNEEEAIKLALQKEVTATRQRLYGGERNAGYGLYMMSEILKKTDGTFAIISNDTLVRYSYGNLKSYKLKYSFNGAVIAFEFFENKINFSFDELRNMIFAMDEEEDDIF